MGPPGPPFIIDKSNPPTRTGARNNMFTTRNHSRSLRTKAEILHMFSPYPECTTRPQCTPDLLERLRAVQIAGARHGKLGWYPNGDFSSDADWCYGVGAEIQALETALDIDDGSVMDLYTDAHSAFFRDGTINPGDRDMYTRNSCFHFTFGAYGDTHVYVWAQADHLEDALEIAAEWLAENAPGHIMPAYGEEHMSLLAEAFDDMRDELLVDGDIDETIQTFEDVRNSCNEYLMAKVSEQAEADMTYTESGYLASHEWYVSESDSAPGPSRRK